MFAGYLFDLDGTVYRGEAAIDGAADFIQTLHQRNLPYLFVTNRGNRTPHEVAASLNKMGILCTAGHILTSSQAIATHLPANSRVYAIGEQGLTSALKDAGHTLSEDNPDAVVVSYDRQFAYHKLTQASRFLVAGAKLYATNDDHLITVEDGVLPEAGPLVAALEKVSGQQAIIAGKPHTPIMKLALERLSISKEQCVILGDNLHTDIKAGQNTSMKTILMLTGVSTRADVAQCEQQPDWVFTDYAALIDWHT